jgi:threonine dehydrogenase-like Zn-dependent dehydrogenase
MGAHEVVDPREEPAVDAWRRLGARGSLVLFEAVGNPGMLDAALRAAPRDAQVLVVGVCMQPDTVHPMLAVAKELNVQFVLAYDPMEFAESLRRIAEGEVDVSRLVTGHVGIDEVPRAFEDLAHPDEQAKILVIPA